jgi:DNA-binding CsgD family transcriptional regulator/PAS domain-containing protein
MGGAAGRGRELERVVEALYDRALAADGCFWCSCLAKLSPAFDATFAAAGRRSGDSLRALHHYRRDGSTATIHGEPQVADPRSVAAESHRMICAVPRPESDPVLIVFWRSGEKPGFTKAHHENLAGIARHLARMALIRDALLRERARRDQFSGMLERLPMPILMTDRTGRVRYFNRMAGELVGRRDGLALGYGGLVSAETAKATADLRRELARLAADDTRGNFATHMVLPRLGCAPPLVLTIWRVEPTALPAETDPVLAIVITNSQKPAGREWGEFANAYGLTKAEARLVTLLADGHGLFEAARCLGISRNTARTHMRSIHAKVGTSGQTDFVRLLERFNPFHSPASLITAGWRMAGLTAGGEEHPEAGE